MDFASDRLKRIQERIALVASRGGRSATDITLLAVTKTVDLERIVPFLDAGVRHVGENRVQEAMDKWPVSGGLWKNKPKIHLIGPLQSNKAKKAVEFFDMIQSLDRWDLAQDLDRHAKEKGKILNCLIQVKISHEATKSGLSPDLLPEFLEKLKGLPSLQVRGLMGIPPLDATGEVSRPYFQRLHRLFDSSRSMSHPNFNILSMGMSSDFEIAIEEGSTMVRLGTVLFGAR